MKWYEKIDRILNRKAEAMRWLEVSGIDCGKHLENGKAQFRKAAVVIAAALPLLLLLSWLTSADGTEDLLRRGTYGDPETAVTVQGDLSAAGQTAEYEFQLEIRNLPLEEELAFALFDQCSQWLTENWFSEGTVCSDLQLPLSFENGLVSITWESSDPARISEEGKVNLLNVPPACSVVLTAVLAAESYEQREDFIVTVKPEGADYIPSLERYAQTLESALNESTEGDALSLPQQDGEIRLYWTFPERKAAWALIPLAAAAAALLYVWRFERLTALLKKQKAAFLREIPSFTLQLILLLNAGLVAEQAFSRLLEHSSGREGPLYASLRTLWHRAKTQNLSFFGELYAFARKTGVRDFIRIAAILHDNSVHGSELAGRLEQERDLLWNERLSAARARAKQADTKLCFPLVLLLLSLVLLAAAPAFMNL